MGEHCTNCGHSVEDHEPMLKRALGCQGRAHCPCPSYIKCHDVECRHKQSEPSITSDLIDIFHRQARAPRRGGIVRSPGEAEAERALAGVMGIAQRVTRIEKILGIDAQKEQLLESANGVLVLCEEIISEAKDDPTATTEGAVFLAAAVIGRLTGKNDAQQIVKEVYGDGGP